MNKSILKLLVTVCTLTCITVGYQNCSKSGFSSTETASSSNVGGEGNLTSMDDNGNLTGEITLTKCPDSGCPGSITLDVDIDNGKTVLPLMAAPDASVVEDGVDPTDLPITYNFTVQIPAIEKCKPIVVTFVNPNTGLTVTFNSGSSFILWGGECGGAVPIAEIVNVTQDGPYITIDGKCTSGKDVVIANGSAGFDSSIRCIGGTFKYCGRIDDAGSILLLLQQIIAQQTAETTHNFTVNIPGLVQLIITNVVVVGQVAKTTVTCTVGSKVTFNIYNTDKAKIDCTTGTITYDVPLLNVSNRVLFVTQTTPFGVTTTVQIDVDANSFTPTCAITEIADDDFCDDRSAQLTGTCKAGWPVLIKVDGKIQNVVLCNGQGQFEADKVVFSDNKGDSVVTIEQINPLNAEKKCSDSRTNTNAL